MPAFSSVGRRGYLELPLRRLQALGPLSGEEEAAVRGLPSARAKLSKGEEMIGSGDGLHFLLDGWGCQVRELAGRRQIFAFVLPGDSIGRLPQDPSQETAFNYKALTPVTLIDASALWADLGDGAPRYSGIQAAVASFRGRARSRLFDHIVRLGARMAYESMAHLLLELHDRQTEVGLAQDGRFAFPIGQERLGEMLGLSSMHVHRTLARLKQDGHLLVGPGWLALPRWHELARAVDYTLTA
jgi:CRP/FNR family transcriptional regulator